MGCCSSSDEDKTNNKNEKSNKNRSNNINNTKKQSRTTDAAGVVDSISSSKYQKNQEDSPSNNPKRSSSVSPNRNRRKSDNGTAVHKGGTGASNLDEDNNHNHSKDTVPNNIVTIEVSTPSHGGQNNNNDNSDYAESPMLPPAKHSPTQVPDHQNNNNKNKNKSASSSSAEKFSSIPPSVNGTKSPEPKTIVSEGAVTSSKQNKNSEGDRNNSLSSTPSVGSTVKKGEPSFNSVGGGSSKNYNPLSSGESTTPHDYEQRLNKKRPPPLVLKHGKS